VNLNLLRVVGGTMFAVLLIRHGSKTRRQKYGSALLIENLYLLCTIYC